MIAKRLSLDAPVGHPLTVSAVAAFFVLNAASAAFAADMPATNGVAGAASVLQVRPDVYMLTVGDSNVALQLGEDGAVVVDTGPPGAGEALLRAIRSVTNKPIRYVIDTSGAPESIGNNGAIADAGSRLGADLVGTTNVSNALGFKGANQPAPIKAYHNVMNRMISSPPGGVAYPGDALPEEFYDTPQTYFYLNSGPIYLLWQPAAHSDGDSVVVFRRDDVVVTGAIFDMTRFPVIDVDQGGSIDGEIRAINRLLDTQVNAVEPLGWREGEKYGTLVIPARGDLSEQADVVQYRDMLTIIRDRVEYYMKQGKTMQQVVALQPAAGYAPRFGATSGPWTTDMFVEAVYKSLKGAHGKGSKSREHRNSNE
jgi:cyclase